jgi:hypothetical protein
VFLSLMVAAVAFGFIGAVVVAIILERAILSTLTRWRPSWPRMLLSALPAVGVGLLIDAHLSWSAWDAIPTAVSAGLFVQAAGMVFVPGPDL